MTAPHSSPQSLPDTQAEQDKRNLMIDKAGIKDLRYPFIFAAQAATQPTVGIWSMYVGVPATEKGTHMSRFLECLDAMVQNGQALGLKDFVALEADMRQRLDTAITGNISVRFPLFVRKEAPVSKVTSFLDYDITISVTTRPEHTGLLSLNVRVPVKSLCPCSKNISEYGAHNQRSNIIIDVDLTPDVESVAIERLIRLAEEEATCEVYGLLKRADEKWVTERAYENPKFVEDTVRDVALRVQALPYVKRFRVAAENFESIHNHSAYAEIEGTGRG
ncbi:MAG: GTP cyclohydrolase FolE2 [Pseudomonadota bacterium]